MKITNDVIVDEHKNETIRCNEKDVVPNVYDADTVGGSNNSQKTEDLFDKDSDDDNNSKHNEHAITSNDDNYSPQERLTDTYPINNSLSTVKPAITNDSVLEDCSINKNKQTTNDISISEVIVPSETQDAPTSNNDTKSTIISLYGDPSIGEYFVSNFVSQLREITEVERKKKRLQWQ